MKNILINGIAINDAPFWVIHQRSGCLARGTGNRKYGKTKIYENGLVKNLSTFNKSFFEQNRVKIRESFYL